eukprot:1152076-Pelagomonas_calceolata.AAC.1
MRVCEPVQVDEHMQHAVQVEPSSFERGLDERRLTFRIDTEGNVLDVNATAPTSLSNMYASYNYFRHVYDNAKDPCPPACCPLCCVKPLGLDWWQHQQRGRCAVQNARGAAECAGKDGAKGECVCACEIRQLRLWQCLAFLRVLLVVDMRAGRIRLLSTVFRTMLRCTCLQASQQFSNLLSFDPRLSFFVTSQCSAHICA